MECRTRPRLKHKNKTPTPCFLDRTPATKHRRKGRLKRMSHRAVSTRNNVSFNIRALLYVLGVKPPPRAPSHTSHIRTSAPDRGSASPWHPLAQCATEQLITMQQNAIGCTHQRNTLQRHKQYARKTIPNNSSTLLSVWILLKLVKPLSAGPSRHQNARFHTKPSTDLFDASVIRVRARGC